MLGVSRAVRRYGRRMRTLATLGTPLTIGMAVIALTLALATDSARGEEAAAPKAGEPPVVGQPLPPLRLPTIDGKQTIDLADLSGRRVLLIEFASW